MNNYKPMQIMKVFECQAMPDGMFQKLREHFDHNRGNDTFVHWSIGSNIDPTETELLIDKWLLENGAMNQEDVLISYWW